MKGDNIGSLSVLMRYTNKEGSTEYLVLYNVTGEQGDLWQRGSVHLSPYMRDKTDRRVQVRTIYSFIYSFIICLFIYLSTYWRMSGSVTHAVYFEPKLHRFSVKLVRSHFAKGI